MPITSEQRQQRSKYLCASDIPIILSLSPFKKTANDIYFSKVYDLPQDEGQQEDYLTTGNLLEDPLLDWAAKELGGVELIRQPWYVCTEGPAAGIFAAHPDAVIVGRPEGMEAKYANAAMGQAYGDEGTDAIPDHVVVQAQVQMLAARLERVWVPVAIAGFSLNFKLYHVPRDDKLIDAVVEQGLAWWEQHVVARVPPCTKYCMACDADVADGETDCPECHGIMIGERAPEPPPIELLKRIRREPESIVDLPEDALRIVFEYQQAKLREKDEKETAEEHYARILEMLGTAEGGRLTDGRLITYMEQNGQRQCKWDILRADYPEAYEKLVTQPRHRVLRIKEAKKEFVLLKGKGE